MSALLALEDVDAYYGDSHVLQKVSMNVGAGDVVLLLGRNGAGKSTTLRAIMGLVPPRGGRILFGGRNIAGWPAHRIARLGIGIVPEDRRMFATLSVLENLELGRKPAPPGEGRAAWDFDRVFGMFPALAPLSERKSGTLSGGQQQMLTIARTLMGNPRLLLLDEPAEGLAPVIAEALAKQLAALRADGLSMLISEQNLSFARSLASHAYVMESGCVRYQGTLAELDANPSAWVQFVAF